MAKKQVKKYGYSCKLDRVVDGDTCDALIDLGFDTFVKKRIRFYGVDTWESRTRNKEEKVKGGLRVEVARRHFSKFTQFMVCFYTKPSILKRGGF